MTKNDGGPAFPNITPDMIVDGGPGMSLRQYYAGQALAGLLASGDEAYSLTDSDDQAHYTAYRAYTMADRMIAEGEKP